MFDGFHLSMIDTGEATIRVRHGGSGPPLLLLHGNPQTQAMWHRIAPRLAEDFSVVVTDLRGYGESSKPASDAEHAPYSKRAMARDQVEVMRQLGFESFFVAGHDRGGRCGYRMALDYPERILKLAVLDIVPTSEAFWRADMQFGLGYYHWFFLAQPHDLPERLIGGAPEYFWRWHTASGVGSPAAFAPEAEEEYLRCFCDPHTLHAICEDYRAGASIDIEHDAEDRRQGRRLSCPLLVLWGAKGALEGWYDVLAVWRDWATDVQGRALDCGHYLPEECPAETLDELRAFFKT
ncbi:alpha/beta fold hydrolase [Halomonas alkalisoli]|uniref:alpha/beta fold hydrolase n=1 Tax=Halomonas alkalisoli TaxID=2907158 RepID=UPI001F3A82C5|nr:alpha/beta hydrolase [Halomonas alkalisoli]MCE9683465.1 alpha/beta hydrolase [Halomonas alkalisoli]